MQLAESQPGEQGREQLQQRLLKIPLYVGVCLCVCLLMYVCMCVPLCAASVNTVELARSRFLALWTPQWRQGCRSCLAPLFKMLYMGCSHLPLSLYMQIKSTTKGI